MNVSEVEQINTTEKAQFPQQGFTMLLKYLNLNEIVAKVMPLSKQVRDLALSENYILFKHFLHYFHMGQRLKRSDIPAKINILQLIQENVTISQISKPENLMPFCFFTDGGVYNDDYYYFLHNIFQKTGVCYSTRVPADANVIAYLGRRVVIDPSQVQPKNLKIKPNDNNTLRIPYESHYADKSEEETYKQLSTLVIHNMAWGYSCFVSAFVLFVADKEINTSKSAVLKAFSQIQTVD